MERIEIVGAWYADDPGVVVAELPSGDLVRFDLVPFRVVTSAELTPYAQAHPANKKCLPMPTYLDRFYGLVRCEQS